MKPLLAALAIGLALATAGCPRDVREPQQSQCSIHQVPDGGTIIHCE